MHLLIQAFYDIVRVWPHDIYDTAKVIAAVESMVSSAKDPEIMYKILHKMYF